MSYMIAGYFLTVLFWLGYFAWVLRTGKRPR